MYFDFRFIGKYSKTPIYLTGEGGRPGKLRHSKPDRFYCIIVIKSNLILLQKREELLGQLAEIDAQLGTLQREIMDIERMEAENTRIDLDDLTIQVLFLPEYFCLSLRILSHRQWLGG